MELPLALPRSRSAVRVIARKDQSPVLRSKLQMSRDLIKEAITKAEKRQKGAAIQPIPVPSYHRKTKSEVASTPESALTTVRRRDLPVLRDSRVNKVYFVPAKPVLLPFAERSERRFGGWLLRQSVNRQSLAGMKTIGTHEAVRIENNPLSKRIRRSVSVTHRIMKAVPVTNFMGAEDD